MEDEGCRGCLASVIATVVDLVGVGILVEALDFFLGLAAIEVLVCASKVAPAITRVELIGVWQ